MLHPFEKKDKISTYHDLLKIPKYLLIVFLVNINIVGYICMDSFDLQFQYKNKTGILLEFQLKSTPQVGKNIAHMPTYHMNGMKSMLQRGTMIPK